MRASVHTPGPWTMRWGGRDRYIIDGHEMSALAVGAVEADARLITAAPAYAWAWEQISEELQDFILSEAPSWVKEAINADPEYVRSNFSAELIKALQGVIAANSIRRASVVPWEGDEIDAACLVAQRVITKATEVNVDP